LVVFAFGADALDSARAERLRFQEAVDNQDGPQEDKATTLRDLQN